MQRLALTTWIALAAAVLPVPAAAAGSYAIVHDNGSLTVDGRTVWLYGIDIPIEDRTCLTFLNPARCGPKAVLMLELKIDSHFVDCRTRRQYADGTVTAVCRVEGTDLSAWMLAQGWAVAKPHAPAAYLALQKQARAHQRGLWNLFPSGSIQLHDSSGTHP